MALKRITVLVKKDQTARKLLKIWFGPDGSYYVAAPYHSARQAYLFKYRSRYDLEFGKSASIPISEFSETATLDDDDGSIKLVHHASGLCQFSGRGILSGIDERGRPKGIGVLTRALPAVGDGPAWALVAYGFEDFDPCDNPGASDLVADFDELVPAAVTEPWPGSEAAIQPREGVLVEGYYFQPQYRKFVTRDPDGRLVLMRVHPTGMILKLAVILSPEDCGHPGFLGLDVYRKHVMMSATSGFNLCGPGETVGEDSLGNRIADLIACWYPRAEWMPAERNVNYPSRDLPSIAPDVSSPVGSEPTVTVPGPTQP
jgi:hypothetical protein